jgi:hypothetical protein
MYRHVEAAVLRRQSHGIITNVPIIPGPGQSSPDIVSQKGNMSQYLLHLNGVILVRWDGQDSLLKDSPKSRNFATEY